MPKIRRLAFLPAPDRLDFPTAEAHIWRGSLDEPLRRVLSRYLDVNPAEIQLTSDERGKPRLQADPDRLSFNLSHSGEIALVAVSRGREVGVDVERERPGRDLVAIAERALTPEDAAAVRGAGEDERTRVFYALWTRHEARLKCLGVGLTGTPTWPVPSVAVENLPVDLGYAAALAVSGDAVPIRCWTLDRPRPSAE